MKWHYLLFSQVIKLFMSTIILQWRNLSAAKKAEYEARAQMQLGQATPEVRVHAALHGQLVIVNKLIWYTDHVPDITDNIPTAFTDHIPTAFTHHILAAFSDHILTMYWPHTDHLPTTFTDHVPTTYCTNLFTITQLANRLIVSCHSYPYNASWS